MSIKPIQVLKSLPFGVDGNGYLFMGIDYQYSYLTAAGQTGTLNSKQTVVVYYKQVFVTNSNYGIIYGTDWGYSDGGHADATTKITYQFAQENNDGTTTILKSGDYWYAQKSLIPFKVLVHS